MRENLKNNYKNSNFQARFQKKEFKQEKLKRDRVFGSINLNWLWISNKFALSE